MDVVVSSSKALHQSHLGVSRVLSSESNFHLFEVLQLQLWLEPNLLPLFIGCGGGRKLQPTARLDSSSKYRTLFREEWQTLEAGKDGSGELREL